MAVLERWTLLVSVILAAATALYYGVLVPRITTGWIRRGLRWLGALPLLVLVTLAAAVALYHTVLVPRIKAGKAQGQFLDQASREDVGAFGFETASGVQSLADLRGKAVVVDVWATWCPPCIGDIPRVVALADKYRDRPVRVIGLSVDKNRWAAVRPFLQNHPEINYTVAVPHPMPLFQLVTIVDLKPLGKVAAVPTVFVIDREGRLAAKFVGDDRYQEIDAFVATLLGEGSSS